MTQAELNVGVTAADAVAVALIRQDLPAFFQSEAQQALTKYMPSIVAAAVNAIDKHRAAQAPAPAAS